MKKKIIGIFICTLVITAVILPATETINEKVIRENKIIITKTSMEFAPGEVIVKLNENTIFSRSSFAFLNEKYQVYAFEKVFPNAEETILDNIYLVHVPINSDILSIVHEYTLCPDVMYAEPNSIAIAGDYPSDVNFSNQYYLHNTGQEFKPGLYGTIDADIDAPEAWDIEKGSSDIVIATPDTGIDYTHPDLAAKIWSNIDEIPNNGIDDDSNGYIDDVIGWDFVENDNDPKDDRGHGTFIAGVAAASTNNNIGIAGVTWNCKLMTEKVVQKDNVGYYGNITKGIKYAVDNGADVISMSFGGPQSSILHDAVDYAYNKGVFMCAIANNYNTSNKQWPAAYENVTAVAATDENDYRYNRSSYGDWVHIAAPGANMYSTTPTYYVVQNDPPYNLTQNYSYHWGGTSFACPQVAGVAALLLSKNPLLTPAEIDLILCANVDPYYSDQYIGTGIVNAHKALLALQLKEEVKIKGGLGVNMVMTNNEASDIINASWRIHVEGGILGKINKTINGTIGIPAGKSKTVSTGMLFGLGDINISARIAGIEVTAKGKQFIIFSFVK